MLRTILRELPEEGSIEQRYSGRSPSYRPVMGDPEDHGSSTTRGTLAFDSDLDVLSAMRDEDTEFDGDGGFNGGGDGGGDGGGGDGGGDGDDGGEPDGGVRGCMDPTADNFNELATVDDNSCEYNTKTPDLRGCTDSTADNYNELATVDDGSCEYTTKTPEVEGCMDSTAANYDPEATVDDGSCKWTGDPEIEGCMEPNAENYNPEATLDDGSCKWTEDPVVHGCTDSNSANYNPLATVDDGSCGEKRDTDLHGCMDPNADNFNELATVDDNSCEYNTETTEVGGCMDPTAANYDPAATVDDGSCEWAESKPAGREEDLLGLLTLASRRRKAMGVRTGNVQLKTGGGMKGPGFALTDDVVGLINLGLRGTDHPGFTAADIAFMKPQGLDKLGEFMDAGIKRAVAGGKKKKPPPGMKRYTPTGLGLQIQNEGPQAGTAAAKKLARHAQARLKAPRQQYGQVFRADPFRYL
jgi:hypothetical protein